MTDLAQEIAATPVGIGQRVPDAPVADDGLSTREEALAAGVQLASMLSAKAEERAASAEYAITSAQTLAEAFGEYDALAEDAYDDEDFAAINELADHVAAVAPDVIPTYVQRWSEDDPDAATSWMETHAANQQAHIRAEQAAIEMELRDRAALQSEAEQARHAQRSNDAVAELVQRKGFDPYSVRGDQITARMTDAMPEVITELTRHVNEGASLDLSNPGLIAEATYRWVEAHEAHDARNAIVSTWAPGMGMPGENLHQYDDVVVDWSGLARTANAASLAEEDVLSAVTARSPFTWQESPSQLAARLDWESRRHR